MWDATFAHFVFDDLLGQWISYSELFLICGMVTSVFQVSIGVSYENLSFNTAKLCKLSYISCHSVVEEIH